MWGIFLFLIISTSPILTHYMYQFYKGLRSTDTQLTLSKTIEEEEEE